MKRIVVYHVDKLPTVIAEKLHKDVAYIITDNAQQAVNWMYCSNVHETEKFKAFCKRHHVYYKVINFNDAEHLDNWLQKCCMYGKVE